MAQLIEWLAESSLSVAIQTNPWVVPTVQSIHIVAIGGVVSAVLMIDLRVLGWAGRDQSLTETVPIRPSSLRPLAGVSTRSTRYREPS